MLLSVVAPAFNEEEIIKPFLLKVTSVLEKESQDCEILVVENGSTDRTRQIVENLSKENKKIKLLCLPKPSYGKALKKGLQESKGDSIVIFNIDFWDSKFLTLAVTNLLGYDIIVGSKNLPGSSDKRPMIRKIVTRLWVFFLKTFFGFSGTDTHGIKILRRAKIKSILKSCRTEGGIFDSEFLIRAQRAGLKILELPVEVTEIRPPRFKGRFWTTFKDIWELWRVLR